MPDGLAALAVTAGVFVFLYARIESGASDTVAVMPYMADAQAYWVYFLSQAFGWSALLWAWLTVVLGLLLSGPRGGRLFGPVRQQSLERLHRTTSLNTMALMFAHALLFFVELLRDESASGWWSRLWSAFVDAFVPGGYSSGTGQLAIPIGLAALYLAVPLGLLFYVRHRISPKAWRGIHRFVIVVYVLSVWHTLLYGTNVWYDGWPRTVLWLLQLPIAALLLVRLLRPARRAERVSVPRGAGGRDAEASAGVGRLWARFSGRVAFVVVVVGTIVALVAVVISGRDGGRERSLAEISRAGPAVVALTCGVEVSDSECDAGRART